MGNFLDSTLFWLHMYFFDLEDCDAPHLTREIDGVPNPWTTPGKGVAYGGKLLEWINDTLQVVGCESLDLPAERYEYLEEINMFFQEISSDGNSHLRQYHWSIEHGLSVVDVYPLDEYVEETLLYEDPSSISYELFDLSSFLITNRIPETNSAVAKGRWRLMKNDSEFSKLVHARYKTHFGKEYVKKTNSDTNNNSTVIKTTSKSQFNIKNGVITKYHGKSRDVIIPEDIYCIGDHAFANNQLVENVIIPEGVTHIDESAFINCERLLTISFPDSLSVIGRCAFWGCKSLKRAILPANLDLLGDAAFSNCFGLSQITIPKTVRRIEPTYLLGCKFISKSGLVITDNQVVGYTHDQREVTIPEYVERIREKALAYAKNLQKVIILNGTVEICPEAFALCGRLKEISIPKSVTCISETAFSGSNVTILTSLGSYAEKYAIENNIPFKIIAEEKKEEKPTAEQPADISAKLLERKQQLLAKYAKK